MKERQWFVMLVAMLALGLSGCGGGGDEDDDEDDGPEDASGAGIWYGTYRVDGTTTNSPFRGIVTEEGDLAFISFNPPSIRQFFGGGNTIGNSFSANAVTYVNLLRSVPAALQGTVIDGTSINGSYSLTGESATFSLQYQRSLYERAASLATIQGVYSLTTSQGATSVVIEANGAVTITYPVPVGCVLNGTLTVPHSNRNYYRLTGTFSNCGGGNGGTTAIIFLDDAAPGQNNRIILLGQNQAQTISGYLPAQK